MDKSYFGSLASHQYSADLYEHNVCEYNKNPKYCKNCGKLLSYEQRHNTFCSSSCSAIYSNCNRRGYKQKEIICKNCGKIFAVSNYSKQQFCSVSCANKYNNCHKPVSKLTQNLLDIKQEIINDHKVMSLRQMAIKYNCSANYLSCFLRKYCL